MLMALVMLCERQPSDPLAPWRKGNELDDAVIKVAAYAPVKYKRKFTGFPFDMEPETFFQQVQNEAR